MIKNGWKSIEHCIENGSQIAVWKSKFDVWGGSGYFGRLHGVRQENTENNEMDNQKLLKIDRKLHICSIFKNIIIIIYTSAQKTPNVKTSSFSNFQFTDKNLNREPTKNKPKIYSKIERS